jgi:glycosyltransferase involved in cell wall biosynthesis
VELLGQAHLFCCLPTDETEAFRQALHEALACGLPVVTTRTSMAPILMAEGCGATLEAETPEALAAAVKACLADAGRYRSMSVGALQTARRYSIERWRETIRTALVEAWGPLRSEPPQP